MEITGAAGAGVGAGVTGADEGASTAAGVGAGAEGTAADSGSAEKPPVSTFAGLTGVVAGDEGVAGAAGLGSLRRRALMF